MSRRRSLVATAVAAVAAGTLTACSTNASGEASPTDAPTPPNKTTITSAKSSNPFAGMHACNLLDKALAGKDFPPGRVSNIGSENGCQTSKPQVASYSLDLATKQSLESFGNNPAKLHDGTVNGRPAVREREGLGIEGSCSIAMAVPPNSMAFVSLTRSNGTTDEACKLVYEVAKKIEPMLPGGK